LAWGALALALAAGRTTSESDSCEPNHTDRQPGTLLVDAFKLKHPGKQKIGVVISGQPTTSPSG
jgi:hypothetical protein